MGHLYSGSGISEQAKSFFAHSAELRVVVENDMKQEATQNSTNAKANHHILVAAVIETNPMPNQEKRYNSLTDLAQQ